MRHIRSRIRPIGRHEVDIGKQDVTNEIAALEQETGRDPASSFRPSGDSRRRKQPLSESACGDVEIRYAWNFSEAELLKRR